MENAKTYHIELSVRDYECDLQGIVNNSVYLNYFEHARHEFLRSAGIDFARLHEDGTDPVVRRIEVDYRRPLVSGDRFYVELRPERKGRLQFLFKQRIIRLDDSAPMATADVFTVFIKQGRPIVPPEKVVAALEQWAIT